ncbi:Uncharacterised protein (plasmid) [Tsukamurella tyrosinosolvens]|uniref:Minor tail protein n=1 Tax=Tsukamurella tyrosinosolvens TaxID=57704 RepID=A0A1H5B1G2_TSUTY|nr:hypothetical protein [Tsukamurella tyrosinosolvens]KXO95200.1 hypothetical protein AXK58_10720 [Tsukamurella tyrosinosolvens]SED48207.1 hypothetical protein SAMN04489793_5058 [Tsukamurella tyrosinosolvens]VEH88875.1 Uncharacterised protein [Tsukamurella tyrosinosolvens]
MAPFDVHAANRHTPRELLDAGGQLALKRDISSPDEVLKIAGQIAALFGFDLEHWQDMFDFDDLRAAIAGEYVGTDPALNAIQTVVGTIRRFATGIIDPSRLPLIPLSHIGEASPNLLENGSFDGDDPIEQTEGWTFNPAIGRTKPGSAQTTGKGTRRVLLSNAVLCTPGQQFDVGGFVTWSMLTGGGAGAFKLSAVAYAADDSHVGETVVASIDSPSGAQAWTGLLGTYTVPEGAAKIRLQIEVAATVTGGTINWDDLSVTKYGNLPQRMVAGLVSALGDLGAGIAAAVEAMGNFFDKLTGKIGTTIADLQSWAGQLKTILSGGTVGSGIFPTLDNGLRGVVSGVQGFAQAILEKIVQAIRGIPVVGAGLADLFDDVAGLRSTADTANATAITADTKAVAAQGTADEIVVGVVDGWAGAGTSNGEVFDTMQAIRTAILNGYTVETITSSGNWAKPTGTLMELVVVGIGSGKNGTVGNAVAPLGGGFLTKAYDPASLPTSVAVVIGTNGNPTKFHTDFQTTPGAGGIATQFGYSQTSSMPGNGGLGGLPNDSQFNPGTAGESTPLAVGGSPGLSRGASGQPGASVDASVPTKCGGAGGGGGASGRNSLGETSGGNGGNGGFPGGAGGNAGAKYGAFGSDGTPGLGAAGVLWVFYR